MDSLKSSAGTVLAMVISSSIGLVWLTVACAQMLAGVVPLPAASAIVGLVLIAVPSLLITWRALTPRTPPVRAAETPDADTAQLMGLATRAAEKLAVDSPLTAVGFAMAAGLLAVHMPGVLAPLLASALDNLAVSKVARPPQE